MDSRDGLANMARVPEEQPIPGICLCFARIGGDGSFEVLTRIEPVTTLRIDLCQYGLRLPGSRIQRERVHGIALGIGE